MKMPWESKQTFFNQHVNNKDSKILKTIRLLYHDYSSNPTLLDGDGSLLNVAQQKQLCEKLYLLLLQSQLSSSNQCSSRPRLHIWFLCPSHCPAQLLCKEESVLELLAGLDVSKSTSCDGISAKM